MIRSKRVVSYVVVVLVGLLLILHGCGGGDGGSQTVAEELRLQDARTFTVSTASLPFAALAGTTAETDRWSGTLG